MYAQRFRGESRRHEHRNLAAIVKTSCENSHATSHVKSRRASQPDGNFPCAWHLRSRQGGGMWGRFGFTFQLVFVCLLALTVAQGMPNPLTVLLVSLVQKSRSRGAACLVVLMAFLSVHSVLCVAFQAAVAGPPSMAFISSGRPTTRRRGAISRFQPMVGTRSMAEFAAGHAPCAGLSMGPSIAPPWKDCHRPVGRCPFALVLLGGGDPVAPLGMVNPRGRQRQPMQSVS